MRDLLTRPVNPKQLVERVPIRTLNLECRSQCVTHFTAIQKIHECERRCPVYLVAYVNVEAAVAKSAAETREMNQEIVLYHAVGAWAPSVRSRRLSIPSDTICRASC